jgi:tetratricopeptide (TPR) repeat protein
MSRAKQPTAEECKTKGTAAFTEGDYHEAVKWYTKGVELDPKNYILYSNRSASFLALKYYFQAFEDADTCISIKGDWLKGYFRKGAVLAALKLWADVAPVYDQGLKCEPNNAEFRNKLDEAVREASVAGIPQKTSDQLKVLLAKEEGNLHFKEGRYLEAIRIYTRGLEFVTNNDEKINLLSNRCVSNAQLQMYKEVVDDANKVLQMTNGVHLKCLLRRALAYESLEKFQLALEDFKGVLGLDPSVKMASEGLMRVSRALGNR